MVLIIIDSFLSVLREGLKKISWKIPLRRGELETLDFAYLATLFWGRENKGMYST